MACFVCSGNECQAPSEFSLIVGICRKLKYDVTLHHVRQQPRTGKIFNSSANKHTVILLCGAGRALQKKKK